MELIEYSSVSVFLCTSFAYAYIYLSKTFNRRKSDLGISLFAFLLAGTYAFYIFQDVSTTAKWISYGIDLVISILQVINLGLLVKARNKQTKLGGERCGGRP